MDGKEEQDIMDGERGEGGWQEWDIMMDTGERVGG